MFGSIRCFVAALCAVVMLAAVSSPAHAVAKEMESQLPEENATSHPVVDALVLRPLGFVSLIGGTTIFVPAAVMTLLTRPQEIGLPFQALVVAPARYVWVDGLGKH